MGGVFLVLSAWSFEVVWAWNVEILVCWGGVGTLLSFEGSGDWLLECLLVSLVSPDGGLGGLVGWLFVNWIVDASI